MQSVYLKFLPIVMAIFALIASLITLLLWSENGFTSKAATWEVVENAIITLMGEYPEKPTTITGRVIQLFLLVFGTLAFGTIVGKISSLFVAHALLQEKVVKNFNDHIIICNWNNKAPTIIHQLLEANRHHPRDIVIISTSVIEDLDDLESQGNVYFIQADPTHHVTLEKFQASQVKAIILLADEETEGPDEKNALIALAIKHLERIPNRQKDIHVVGELVNLDRRRHLKEAGVDEVISAGDYSSGIIAQSAVFKNMSVVYQQLLTYSDCSNEFYYITPERYPEYLLGKTFTELSKWISNDLGSQEENPLILIGIKRGNGEILLNPKQSHFQRLAAEDSLIVMAYNQPM